MKNFLRIAQGLDTMPLLEQLQRKPDLWNAKRYRTTFHGTPHAGVDDIWIRFSDDNKMENLGDTSAVMNDGSSVWHEAYHFLPAVKPLIRGLMAQVYGYSLERCVITKLAPGARVMPHADDQGAYVHMGDIARYHVVLQGLDGSLFKNGDEVVTMRTGEVWLFNPHVIHECLNDSADDRIHMLVDLRTMT